MKVVSFVFDDGDFVGMQVFTVEEYEKKFNYRFDGNHTKHYDKAEGRFSFTNKYRANEWLLDNEIYEFMSDDEWIRLINNLYAVYKA